MHSLDGLGACKLGLGAGHGKGVASPEL